MLKTLSATLLGLAALSATPALALRTEPTAVTPTPRAHGTVQGATLWYLLVDLALQNCQDRTPGRMTCATGAGKSLN